MSWHCVPASAGWSSDCTSPSPEQIQSYLSSKTPGAEGYSPPVGQACPSGMTSSVLTRSPGADKSTCSPQDSPASPGRSRASVKAPLTSVGSGPRLRQSFALWDRGGSCWKTSQLSLLEEDCPSSQLTWPRWGSLRSGECFPAPPWVPAIAGSGSLCWPTPKASNCDKGGRPRANDRGDLCASAQGWRTPTANDSKGSAVYANGELKLTGQARDWATPTARDWRSGKSNLTSNSRPLSEQAERYGPLTNSQTGEILTQPTGLNSRFVEWLMGFPDGWSRTENIDCEPWETQCRHLLRRWRGPCSKPA